MKKFWANCKKKFLNKRVLIGGAVILAALIITIIGVVNMKRPDAYQLALDNIAEARFYMKSAAADNPIGTIQLYSGIRESDFQADGIATASKPFTVLSVEPADERVVYNGCITTEITINDAAPVTLILEKNPYGNNYAADLEKALDESATVKVTFKAGTETMGAVALTNVMPEDAIKWETALEIACKELASLIATDVRVESSTKILCDNTTVSTPYWFVSFVTEDGNRYFVVIDPTGKVIGTSEK